MAGVDELLVSLQLADTAFPSGFYTLSHGLEGYTQAHAVDADTVRDLLCDLLRHSVGPADGTAVALTHAAVQRGDWERAMSADRRLFATKLNREVRQAVIRTGRQMLDVAAQSFGGPELARFDDLVRQKRTPGTQPAVAGVVYAGAGVPAERAVASELFAFCSSFAGAALRLRLTDHRTTQTVLRDVAPVIAEAAAAAVDRDIGDLGGCAPMTDVMCGRHERAEARMFAT